METSILVSIMCCLILITMSILVQSNASISKVQRNGFIRTFLLVVITILLELATRFLNGSDPYLIPLHLITNYLGFLLSPLIVINLIVSVVQTEKVKKYYILGLSYALLLSASIPFKVIFSINERNQYTREQGFFLFIFIYLLFEILLIIETLQMYKKYQKTQFTTLFPLFILTILGSSVQIIDPSLHITWLSITFIVILYYIHCSNLWHQIDGLTGLLTQKVYLHDLPKIKTNNSVYVFDIDRFKDLNDCHGHYEGDKVLKELSGLILDVFGDCGTCYRIGGDEMSVIIHKKVDIDALVNTFEHSLGALRLTNPYFPTVSIGCSIVNQGEDGFNIFSQADQNMYINKEKSKKLY